MNTVKKVLVCFFAVLVFAILTSCNSVDQVEDNYEERIIVDGWMQAVINRFNMKNDIIYFSTFEEVGELNGELTSNNHLYAISKNASQPQEISVELGEEYQHVMVSDIMCDNEMISVWLSTSDQDEYEPINLLIQMDLSYNVINKVDLNQIVNNENILKVLQSSKGYYVCMAANNLYIIDKDMKLVGSFDINGNAIGIAFTNEEKVLCLKKDHDKKKVMIFDLDKLSNEKELSAESCDADSEYGIISSGKFDFNYRTDDGIYAYSINDQKSVCLFDFDRYGIDGEEIVDVLCSDKDEIAFSIQSNEGRGTRIALYSPNENQNKKTKIVFGVFQMNTRIRNAVQIFNRNNNDYVIETKEYYNEDEGESYDDAIRKINEDIASGSVPDLLDLSLLSDRFASKGLYEDISSYIVNSPKVSEDMLLENVLEALKKDDKLYTITPGFSIMTLICKKGESDTYNGLNIDKFEKICKDLPDGNFLLAFNTKDELLSILLDGCLGDYYDWESGTCQFDSREFKQLLEICDSFEFDNNLVANKHELIQKNKMPLVAEAGFVPSDIIDYRNLFGDEIKYIGYPNNNGSNSYFMFENQIGIYSNSKEKDGAWQFIEMILSYDYQKRFVDIYNDDPLIPMRKDCYNELLDNLVSSEEIKLSIEESDDFMKMVNSTQKSSSYDMVMLQIIFEEAQDYFNERKSVDETVKLIQSRCETYMREAQ